MIKPTFINGVPVLNFMPEAIKIRTQDGEWHTIPTVNPPEATILSLKAMVKQRNEIVEGMFKNQFAIYLARPESGLEKCTQEALFPRCGEAMSIAPQELVKEMQHYAKGHYFAAPDPDSFDTEHGGYTAFLWF